MCWTAIYRALLKKRLGKSRFQTLCILSLFLFIMFTALSRLYQDNRRMCDLTVYPVEGRLQSIPDIFHIDINEKLEKQKPTETCKRKSTFDNNGEFRQCIPLMPIEELKKTYIENVVGKYMKDTKELRKDAEFLVRPDIATSPFSTCKTNADDIKWTLIFLVKSSVKNYERRNAIRSTWGSVKLLNSVRLETVFILGTTDDKVASEEVRKENQLHGDILQMSLQDSAKTVPEKILAGMQWSSEVLSSSWLYASVDDDIVVQISNLVNYLDKLLTPDISSIDKIYHSLRPCYEDLPLVCVYQYQTGDIPARNAKSKWYISEEEFPDPYWPKYCRGGLYVMPVEMVKRMYQKSKRTSYLNMDDVWITGFMRRKLGEQDCNILPAPYSQFPDGTFWKMFYYTGGSKAFVKHLWGNIDGQPVDVENSIKQVWTSWKDNVLTHDVCVRN